MDKETRQRSLTNELISKRYKSQFDLVNHAIRLAGHMIQAGYEPSPASADNIVNDVLKDIEMGRDDLTLYEVDEEEELDLLEVEEEAPQPKKGRGRAAKEVAKR